LGHSAIYKMKKLRIFHFGHYLRTSAVVCSLALIVACSSTPPALPGMEGDYLDRAQTQEKNGIRVTAGVPSAEESKELFGTSLYRRGVQPVWLSIENSRDEHVSFLPVGLDPTYFTPIEAANLNVKDKQATKSDSLINQQFFKAGLGMNVPSHGKSSGFIFSKLDEGTKAFNVDVISDSTLVTFTFFIPVPGLRIDHQTVDWPNLYPADEIKALSQDELIANLESAICCVMDKKNADMGDPLNLVVIGDSDDVYYAFIRAGWDETETVNKASAWKTMRSFIGGGEYRYSPVSALYVFNRPQDVAFQRARDNIHERNHLRLWMSPYRYEGKPVWIGQISRDIGVRFTKKTITTHKIDPDVDETREFLLENLVYSQALQKFAYVGGVGEAPIDQPRGNLTGDPYFTDGFRLVLWVTSQPVDIADLEIGSWRIPPDRKATP
jgi:hypothetical protein